jgi:hypothetical protein
MLYKMQREAEYATEHRPCTPRTPRTGARDDNLASIETRDEDLVAASTRIASIHVCFVLQIGSDAKRNSL